MSNIVFNLKKFFSEQQDEAAIPGLGVFYKSDSAILFAEKTPRSNAFVNFFGYEENLTENEAIEVIELWVSDILSDLRKDKLAYIPELGTFEIQKDKVIFTPAKDQNLQTTTTPADNYGLDNNEEVLNFTKPKKTKKINDMTRENLPQKKEKKPMNPAVLWSIIGAVVVLLIGAFIIFGGIEGLRDGFGTRAPQAIVIGPAFGIGDEFDDLPEMPQLAQLQFAVIGGAFGIRTNAEAFLAQMRSAGYDAELIFDMGRQLHLVSLGSFRTQDEAIQFRNRVRTTTNITDAWIFTR